MAALLLLQEQQGERCPKQHLHLLAALQSASCHHARCHRLLAALLLLLATRRCCQPGELAAAAAAVTAAVSMAL
jgi:hypothetical protein